VATVFFTYPPLYSTVTLTYPYCTTNPTLHHRTPPDPTVCVCVCSTVHGRIDQVHQLLELQKESAGVARYNAMDKWSQQIASLHDSIINRVA